ncbi:MAG TPA: TonB family protein [Casimicrobiaceae bacterium]|nr:TonB family protein [Casimicrobiaceae bacterium]
MPRRVAAPKPVQELAAEARPAAPSPARAPNANFVMAGALPPARKPNLAMAGALPPARIPPEALATPRRVSTVAVAIALSVVLHAVALSLHFTVGSGRNHDPNPPLEVALVNAKSLTKPTKADLLAQANLDGGGNTEQNRRAKTPLPALPDTQRRNVAVAASRQEVQENTTQEMMTRLRSPTAIPTPEPKPLAEPEPTESPTANDIMQKTLEAVRLEAKIARDMDEYQKIPRRKHIGAQAREYRFARYVEDWRMKVERVGNTNYPAAARQKKLYGSLILTVFIRADGSVEKVEVNRKSGQRILDAAAVKIVEMAGPYAPFPDDIRRDTDILSITRTWTFARGDEFSSE